MRYLVTTLAAALLAGGMLPAQETVAVSASVGKSHRQIQKTLVALAEKMPEEHYDFKPAAAVKTFGELVGHVARHQAAFCAMSMGEGGPRGASEAKTKAELVAALRDSFAVCNKAHEALTDENATEIVFRSDRATMSRFELLLGDVTHSWEEYGYMAVYLRLKGIIPPSSDPGFRKTLR